MQLSIVPFEKKYLKSIKKWYIARNPGEDVSIMGDWLSKLGFVGLIDGKPAACVFGWRDVTSKRGFIDALSTDPKADREQARTLSMGCYRAMAEAMRIAGVRWLSTTATHPFVENFFASEQGATLGLAARLIQVDLQKATI